MLPIQITLKDLPPSPALEQTIQEKADKLTRMFKQIMSLHVVVELPQKHRHKLYNVRLDLKVPGKELVVTHKTNEVAYIAVRDAFEAITRQLSNEISKRRNGHKSQHEVLQGQVVRLMHADGYGFIEGSDGNEYYFHSDQLANTTHFKEIAIGDEVEFVSLPLKDGLQAQHVIKT